MLLHSFSTEIYNAVSWFLSMMHLFERIICTCYVGSTVVDTRDPVVKRLVLSLPLGILCSHHSFFSLLHQLVRLFSCHVMLAFLKIFSWGLFSLWSEIHPRTFCSLVYACKDFQIYILNSAPSACWQRILGLLCTGCNRYTHRAFPYTLSAPPTHKGIPNVFVLI